MRITRKPRTSHFTVVPNGLIEDSRLSFKARGLLVYLLSQPDDWQTDAHRLAGGAPDGRSAILSGLKELEEAGYLTRARSQDARGRWVTVCELSDTPTGVRFPDVGSPDAGPPDSGPPDAGPLDPKVRTNTKQEPPTVVPARLASRDEEISAQAILGAFIDWVRANEGELTKRTVGQLARQIGDLIAQGVPDRFIRKGLADWYAGGQHPATLDSFVNSALNAAARGHQQPASRRQQETDALFDRAMRRAEARERTSYDAEGNGAAHPVRQGMLPPAAN